MIDPMLESVTMCPNQIEPDCRPGLRPVLTAISMIAVLAVAAAMAEGGTLRVDRLWSIEQVLLESALCGSGPSRPVHHGAGTAGRLSLDRRMDLWSGAVDVEPASAGCVLSATRCGEVGIEPIAVHPDLELVADRVAGLSPPVL